MGNFIKRNENFGVIKTDNKNNAEQFSSMSKANRVCSKAPAKTKGYYPVDIKIVETGLKIKRSKRITLPESTRKMVYIKANGICQLCGKKIGYDEMTIDHIIPLCMGGNNEDDNLQCACASCNEFKGPILPEEFLHKINDIFLYQMNKKYKDFMIKWKNLCRIMENM